MLGGQPSPHGFLGRIIGHAEAFPIYLKEEGWHHFSIETFSGYGWLIYSAVPFMPSCGLSQGIPSSYWSNDDVTPLPAKAPPPLGEPTNQGCSRPDAILHMRYVFGQITPSFISLPASEGKTTPVY